MQRYLQTNKKAILNIDFKISHLTLLIYLFVIRLLRSLFYLQIECVF